ncbi:60S ribosomal protein L37a-2 [Medicago truncatula]|uniref:60S ribosomal protein L37a-2 n=1 Tax=Medicago truncatula TaxID=3880 RepID=A0A072TFU7_MEDTR|nr:60S ribosomal protein L37a-2 [Medicago truncatula]
MDESRFCQICSRRSSAVNYRGFHRQLTAAGFLKLRQLTAEAKLPRKSDRRNFISYLLRKRDFHCSTAPHTRLSLIPFKPPKMTKRTKKAGIVGKYGTRYGASLRKQIKKMEVSQHSKFFCEFCGKYAVKRKAVGIWGCKDCGKVKAGGAYTLNTASAVTVRSTIRRLREQTES